MASGMPRTSMLVTSEVVERSGAEGDEVGVGDGVEGGGEGFGAGRQEHQLDDAVGAGGDAGFAWTQEPSSMRAARVTFAVGCGIDAASCGENLGGHLHGWAKSPVMPERARGRDCEAVALQAALLKAVLEEAGEQELVLGEGDHAVADVAGREHVEFVAETAGGAPVVCDGDDGGEVADEQGRSAGSESGWGLGLRRVTASVAWRAAAGAATYRLRPRSRVERPVPPPMATTLRDGLPF